MLGFVLVLSPGVTMQDDQATKILKQNLLTLRKAELSTAERRWVLPLLVIACISFLLLQINVLGNMSVVLHVFGGYGIAVAAIHETRRGPLRFVAALLVPVVGLITIAVEAYLRLNGDYGRTLADPRMATLIDYRVAKIEFEFFTKQYIEAESLARGGIITPKVFDPIKAKHEERAPAFNELTLRVAGMFEKLPIGQLSPMALENIEYAPAKSAARCDEAFSNVDARVSAMRELA
ncbi:MAG: hypothetical protein NUV56_04640 [Candidatus Uhrbacteria bacterium]|nr:hypothetical protein [Candidatus Uhrbacteria bacterium]